MKLRTRMLSCGTRWGSRVNRPRACLRRDHAPLRNNGLAGRRLRRSCCGSGRSRRLCSHGRCRFICRSGSGRGFRRRCNNCRGRLRLRRRRCDHDCGRCRRFFNFFLCWRSRRWRDNWRRLARRRHNYRTLNSWRGSFGRNFFRCRRLRCNSRRGLRLRRSRRRRFHHGCRPRRRRWMLEFLLPLFQQSRNIARLGNLGEIDLRLDLWRRSSLPGGSPGFRDKVSPDLFRFIGLDRA